MGNSINLSLQCPSCSWEWSDYLDCDSNYLTPACPKCFHQPVLILKILIA